ncbi:MAG: GTPase ObgE [Anaerolineales bacterium]|nr:GTPase ObgE [Anaerolineales bacterium]
MFIDEARIFVASGRGGDGVVHFRREKYVPRGGPDGGDGGKGGDVIIEATTSLTTLHTFRNKRHFKAKDGLRGGGNNKTGANGESVNILVPCGTLVYLDEGGALLGDLVEDAQQLTVCTGGRGGRGNARFATSRNQAPRMAERGEPGEERWLRMELRLIADVGIVGVPNAGKSTLLAAVTNARPKIASYPFTTLQPNLGVAELDVDALLVLADIPGLIEGAHIGAGLGTTFLRHVQRTKVLIHLVDGSSSDPLADFSQVNTELALFDEDLAQKPQIVAINKLDLPEVEQSWPELEQQFKQLGFEPMAISALARTGTRPLLWAAYKAKEEVTLEPEIFELPVYQPEEDPTEFEITVEPDGAWRVSGKAVERSAAMVYWDLEEAVRRFQRILEHLGVEEALLEAGAKTGDTVRIGEFELEWQD